MKLSGKIIKDARIQKEILVEKDSAQGSFRDLLEECFLDICRELDTQVPLWLEKNTKEFVAYRKTFFPSDQFIDMVSFDRLEIKLEQ